MKLIVGLGNPGAEYTGTRHNVGFEVIEILSRRHRIPVTKRDFKAVIGDGLIGAERIVLARPMTFMNLSGEAVAAIMRFYKIPPEDVIVIFDDVAIPPGQLRLRLKGSAGGHNGLANIITHLHTQEVPRIRIGVGAAQPGDMVGHVLSRFRKEELPVMQEAYERAADAAETALSAGFETAMNRFNPNEKKEKPTRPKKQDEQPLETTLPDSSGKI